MIDIQRNGLLDSWPNAGDQYYTIKGFRQDGNRSIFISSKANLNITFNLNQCGYNIILPGTSLSVEPGDLFACVCIGSGTMLLKTGNLTYNLSDKHGLFIFPDASYHLINEDKELPLEITWVSFSGHLVEFYLNRSNIYRTLPFFSDTERYCSLGLNNMYTISQNMPNRYCKMMSIIYDIFSYLLDNNPTHQPEGINDIAQHYAIQALNYIEQNYSKNISVEEIAASLKVSRKHLHSIFNKIFKTSPKKYLIYYRIEKACIRLKNSDQSIQETAESVGYSNQFYFAKAFKHLIGMTPSEYRKSPKSSDIFSKQAFSPTFGSKTEFINL